MYDYICAYIWTNTHSNSLFKTLGTYEELMMVLFSHLKNTYGVYFVTPQYHQIAPTLYSNRFIFSIKMHDISYNVNK